MTPDTRMMIDDIRRYDPKEACPPPETIGEEEFDACGHLLCRGTLILTPAGDCRCLVVPPPCGACTEAFFQCDKCGRITGDHPSGSAWSHLARDEIKMINDGTYPVPI